MSLLRLIQLRNMYGFFGQRKPYIKRSDKPTAHTVNISKVKTFVNCKDFVINPYFTVCCLVVCGHCQAGQQTS